MRLKLDQWEVLHAIERYLKDEYGVQYDITEGLEDNPVIEYQEAVPKQRIRPVHALGAKRIL